MIFDVSGIELIPGYNGKDCPGNGLNILIECCCDECDFLKCCTDENFSEEDCKFCNEYECPRKE